ncbi:hypothetical protein F4553_007050 [Allocatelliglobosispora scoriae]|uniref:Uncharacterized protein n=1 Tax=Allocatelliglobosispora scoriae TaxID=643052 RepID=A0A841C172_9ACTN|nr:hypothetical protein [Allocatelliglobosispora scoriae]MBB5873616.1 hypothetical protein [Allocatelliglobosispora scoriae]
MPDLLSEDDTRSAFADVRAAELSLVRPPGTAAAHRTVRRRRTTAALTVAGCAALVLGAASLGIGGLGDDGETPGAPPSGEAVNLTALAEIARAALPLDDEERERVVNSSSGPLDADIRNTDDAGRATTYQLLITCVGAGSIHFQLAAGANRIEEEIDCGATRMAAAGGAMLLSLPGPESRPHEIAVTVEPDVRALYHAGYAYVVMQL